MDDPDLATDINAVILDRCFADTKYLGDSPAWQCCLDQNADAALHWCEDRITMCDLIKITQVNSTGTALGLFPGEMMFSIAAHVHD